jgi:hypothetical protein
MHRIRLTYSAGWLLVSATNGQSAALARVQIIEDSRDPLNAGRLDPDDAPMIVDLQPRRVPLILQQHPLQPRASDVDQLLAFDIDLDPGDPFVDITDVGGLFTEGESHRYPLDKPADLFPDVIGDVAKALANIGQSTGRVPLKADGELIALFDHARKAYEAPLRWDKTGTVESRGFVVRCGDSFVGTIESRHGDDDGVRDAATLRSWLELIPVRRLQSA